MLGAELVERLYRKANGAGWRTGKARFAQALEAAVGRAFASRTPAAPEVERFLTGLHLDDLALACACADGEDQAWEHFVREHRPLLYRAADAIDPTGGARNLADSLYADLFGLRNRDGERQSLFRYFHGRSSLTTWLRAVLAQRHVDRLRTTRHSTPLPDDESPAALSAPAEPLDPDRDRYLGLMRLALAHVLAHLAPRDRLRLACYYAQELTLAQTGRMLGEHEATSSRQLARTRRDVRVAVERYLQTECALSDAAIAQSFEYVTQDVGPLDLRTLLTGDTAAVVSGGSGAGRKNSTSDRSS